MVGSSKFQLHKIYFIHMWLTSYQNLLSKLNMETSQDM